MVLPACPRPRPRPSARRDDRRSPPPPPPALRRQRPDAGGADPGLLANPRTSTATASPPSPRMSRRRSSTSPERPVPEAEVLAQPRRPRPRSPQSARPARTLGALLGQRPGRRDLHNLVGPVSKQHLPPQPNGREQPGRITRPQHGPRMRLEGRRNDPHVPPPPLLHGPPQDLLMARDAPRRSSRARRLLRAKHHLGPRLVPLVPVHRQQLVPHTSPCNCHPPHASPYCAPWHTELAARSPIPPPPASAPPPPLGVLCGYVA